MSPVQLLEKQPLVNQFLHHKTRVLASVSFINIFLWQDFFRFEFHPIDGYLCVFAKSEIGEFLYLPPLGQGDLSHVYTKCFGHMAEVNCQGKMSRVENVDYRQREILRHQYVSTLKCYEYYYFKKDIIALRGNAYKSQRSLCNYFIKNYSCRYLPYEESMFDECMALLGVWTQKKQAKTDDPVLSQMLEENVNVNQLALRFAEPLGLTGRVVLVDGKIKGYTFGFPLSDRTFCVLLEIADISVKGISCYIYREFLNDAEWGKFDFVNAMDAWGLDSVEQTKKQFHPVMLMPSYTITQREEKK